MLNGLYCMVHRSIARACSNLGSIDRCVSDAVDTRMEVDLRIGEHIQWYDVLCCLNAQYRYAYRYMYHRSTVPTGIIVVPTGITVLPTYT